MAKKREKLRKGMNEQERERETKRGRVRGGWGKANKIYKRKDGVRKTITYLLTVKSREFFTASVRLSLSPL